MKQFHVPEGEVVEPRKGFLSQPNRATDRRIRAAVVS